MNRELLSTVDCNDMYKELCWLIFFKADTVDGYCGLWETALAFTMKYRELFATTLGEYQPPILLKSRKWTFHSRF